MRLKTPQSCSFTQKATFLPLKPAIQLFLVFMVPFVKRLLNEAFRTSELCGDVDKPSSEPQVLQNAKNNNCPYEVPCENQA